MRNVSEFLIFQIPPEKVGATLVIRAPDNRTENLHIT
jgi:hypothetical protein